MPAPEEPDLSRTKLLEQTYDEMRLVARRRIARIGHQSLQATELVNEAWLRLEGQQRHWTNRYELFGLAARAMRDILVDRARSSGAQKRGGDWERVNWENALQVAVEHPEQLLQLDRAVSRLGEHDAACAEVVELLFFAGLSGDEAARALNVSPSTIDRRWSMARAWLRQELSNG